MKEFIERAALLNEFCRDNCERQYDGTCHNCRMTDTIADFPAADVVEVKHGRWIHLSTGDSCSECGYQTGRYEIGKNYCPNCGALMDGKEDEHEIG